MAKAALASVPHFEQTADSRQRTAQESILLYLPVVSCPLENAVSDIRQRLSILDEERWVADQTYSRKCGGWI